MANNSCKRCGKCCHDVPLDPNEAAMFSYIAQLKGIELNLSYLDNRKSILIGLCPFLKDDNTCEIYRFRPYAGRIYPVVASHKGQDKYKQG